MLGKLIFILCSFSSPYSQYKNCRIIMNNEIISTSREGYITTTYIQFTEISFETFEFVSLVFSAPITEERLNNPIIRQFEKRKWVQTIFNVTIFWFTLSSSNYKQCWSFELRKPLGIYERGSWEHLTAFLVEETERNLRLVKSSDE